MKWLNDHTPEVLAFSGLGVVWLATLFWVPLVGVYLVGLSLIVIAWIVAVSRKPQP